MFRNTTQKINDRKLEFFTYSSIRDIKSKKKERIFSGEGPFKLQFKKIKANVIKYFYFIYREKMINLIEYI